MLHKVYAIYDSGVSTWMKPIFAKNNGEILRSFMEACNDVNTQFSKYPSDYTLFELGTFDDDKCLFDLFVSPSRLAVAIEMVKPKADVSGV